jgi:hypothetical protein
VYRKKMEQTQIQIVFTCAHGHVVLLILFDITGTSHSAIRIKSTSYEKVHPNLFLNIFLDSFNSLVP